MISSSFSSSQLVVLFFKHLKNGSSRRRGVVVANRRSSSSNATTTTRHPTTIKVKHGGINSIIWRKERFVSSDTSAAKQLLLHNKNHPPPRSMATLSMNEDHHRGVTSKTSTTMASSSSSSSEEAKQETTMFLLNPVPDFTNAQAAYATRTTRQLVRAHVVFTLCRIPPLVRHAESLLKLSRRICGDRFTDFVLKQTMFGHFCAGEDETSIVPTIQALERAGIGSILDFAAESDNDDDDSGSTKHSTSNAKKTKSSPSAVYADHDHHHGVSNNNNSNTAAPAPVVGVVARVYDYESEAQCDAHVATFKRCIHDVKNLGPDGFAAIKVTALGNPKLLERMSRAIVETQNLFRKFDANGDGIISRDEFEQGYKVFFQHDNEQKLRRMLDEFIVASSSTNSKKNNSSSTDDDNGGVDYITWSMTLSPSDLPQITARCRDIGPLALATPTPEEVELIENLYARGHALAQEAATCGTRLLIDAEQVRFQPAIDNLVLELQRKHNSVGDGNNADFPIIYNTYQCYLKDAPHRLATDVERSERFQYHFGAKLVRGAYMESERALAKLRGYPSPIHESMQETHDCYNDCVNFLLQHAASSSSSSSSSLNNNKKKKKTEMMLATHNQQSIEKAINAMNAHGISRHGDASSSSICFGQLLGMADHLSFNLGQHGYRAYKYVPYGQVKMVMPYLIRRANENSSALVATGAGGGGAAQELNMIQAELKRRFWALFGFAY